MKKSDIFWQSYLNLEKELIEVSKYIFITDEIIVNKNGVEESKPYVSQLETFSPHIADLLVQCCVQIEAISKELYFDNGGIKQRGDKTISYEEDCLTLIDKKWKTHDKQVMVVAPFFNLTNDKNRILKPLKEAHKRGRAYWSRAYQAVKHDRYLNLGKGNVLAYLQALAALYLLNLYYRKDSRVIKYGNLGKQDYRMGSALFAVKAPASDNLWSENSPIESESPYVVSYQDNVFKQIEEIRRREDDALTDYLYAQPELKEQAFLRQLQLAEEKGEDVNHICELARYRLNKKIPGSLPFAERKALLVGSEEWNDTVFQSNGHLKAEELTEENIQREIDVAGILWGWKIIRKIKKAEWLPIAMGNGLCKVYIPD